MENRGINSLFTMRKSYKITENIMEKYKFKIGDKVVVVKTDFTEEEWFEIGKVDIFFNIGDKFIVKDIHDDIKGIEINSIDENDYTYPISGFELVKSEPENTEPENLDYLIDIFSKLDIK